ncbi:MAG: DUF4837 family protein [Cyclobacteriaceae bacterium]
MKVLRSTRHLVFILGMIVLFSCSSEKNEKRTKSYLPVARGAEGVILVVMDSVLWYDSLGAELKKTFANPIPGLPQEESYFTIRLINPLKLNDILKAAKNMIFVTTLDQKSRQSSAMRNYMTQESLKKIQANPNLFKFSNKDAYAKGQEILHLFGQTQDKLIANIRKNRASLRNYFLSIEKSRIASSLFKKEEKNATRNLEEKHGFSLRIPYGFDVAKNDKNFVWIRFMDPEYEKNVFVHYEPYTSKEPFDDPVAYREKITRKYLRDSQKPEIFMTIQDVVPHHVKEVNFNGKYAKETRGLWKFSDISGGGGYVSYVFVDESQKRMYYLEGYVYRPGYEKREFMREMEVIVSTFKSGQELAAKK